MAEFVGTYKYDKDDGKFEDFMKAMGKSHPFYYLEQQKCPQYLISHVSILTLSLTLFIYPITHSR